MSQSGINNLERRRNKMVGGEILKLKSYHVPSSEGMIKLDAMENPYSLPQELKQAWLSSLSKVEVNRYPDPECARLKSAIRKNFPMPDNCELLLGNGSDELIQLIAMLFGGRGKSFLSLTPSFSMYQQICIATATRFVGVSLKSDFSLDAGALFQAIEESDPACIFIAYPNNPTGNCFDPELMRQVISQSNGLVIVDEAYFAFCQKSFLEEINQHPNLLILRTMSKSGLAGLRLGMMMGNPLWIEQLDKLRLPYNVNSLTQTSAEFYLQHHDILKEQVGQIVASRAKVFEVMRKISQIEVFPSETNFLLFSVQCDAPKIFQGLKDKGVLIKNLHQPGTALENCFRVTIGTEDENDKFIEALKSVV